MVHEQHLHVLKLLTGWIVLHNTSRWAFNVKYIPGNVIQLRPSKICLNRPLTGRLISNHSVMQIFVSAHLHNFIMFDTSNMSLIHNPTAISVQEKKEKIFCALWVGKMTHTLLPFTLTMANHVPLWVCVCAIFLPCTAVCSVMQHFRKMCCTIFMCLRRSLYPSQAIDEGRMIRELMAGQREMTSGQFGSRWCIHC